MTGEKSDIMDAWERAAIVNRPEDFLAFARVENKRSSRPDLHAFLLLDELFPSEDCIVSGSIREEIYLSIGVEQVKTLTDDQILELYRCGVSASEEGQCLRMFAVLLP